MNKYRVLAPCKQCGHVRLVCRYKPAALCKTCSLENQRKVLATTMRRPYLPINKR